MKKESSTTSLPLDFKAVLVLLILSISWGVNQVTIKVANEAISPVLQSALRSIIASVLIWIWMLSKRQPLLNKDNTLKWGLLIGLLFSVEFMLIYWGLDYTSASRSVIFLYLTPFVVAIGSQLFIPDEKLRLLQVVGLVGAFVGIIVAFSESLGLSDYLMLVGDGMIVLAAVMWGSTTIVIKISPLAKISPAKVLLYQLGFSAIFLPILSLVLNEQGIKYLSPLIISCILYQGVWVAFVTYLAWFWLIRHYQVSRISSFTFLTPIFGVLAGAILLSELISLRLLIALVLVCVGVYLVNKPQS